MQRRVLAGLVIVWGVLVLGAGEAEAQRPLYIIAGPTFGTLVGDDADDENLESKTGFFAGVGTAIAINETFAIEPALVYIQKGASSPSDELSLNNIEIPVQLTANFPLTETIGLSVGLGPQISFNLSCDISGDDCGENDEFNKTDFGIVGTAGINFPLNDRLGIAVGGGFDMGMKNVFEDFEGKTRTYFLYVGIGIPIGG